MGYPIVEITAYMAMSMGMLDMGMAVLSSEQSRPAWKVLAAFECALALLFVYAFMDKGTQFHEYNKFVPNNNVRPLRLFKRLDANRDGVLSEDEVVEGRALLNITSEHEARALFRRLDVNRDGGRQQRFGLSFEPLCRRKS